MPSHDPSCPRRSHKNANCLRKTPPPRSGRSGGINSNRLENTQLHLPALRSNKSKHDTHAGRSPRSKVLPVAPVNRAQQGVFSVTRRNGAVCQDHQHQLWVTSSRPALPDATLIISEKQREIGNSHTPLRPGIHWKHYILFLDFYVTVFFFLCLGSFHFRRHSKQQRSG